MVRGRLTAVNGASLDTRQYDNPRARRLAEREFNLSFADRLPSTNRVSSGTFWGPGAKADAGLSMEDGIAESLRLKLGDELTFDIAGAPVSARITSLRKVDWDSFRPELLHAVPARRARRDADVVHGCRPRRRGPRSGAWVSGCCSNTRTCSRSTSAT
jgi:putative ABC transport system permease protein